MTTFDNIDAYSIATNGLIASDPKYFILDPLGYYVIKVEDIIVEEGGAAFFPPKDRDKQKKKKKIIRLTAYSRENKIDFVEEIEVDNINLYVKDVKLEDDKLVLEVHDATVENSNPEFIRVKFDPISVNVTSISES